MKSISEEYIVSTRNMANNRQKPVDHMTEARQMTLL